MPLSIVFTLVLAFSGVPGIFALDWDGFTNNFITDFAPLITLFGEQVTKQFLSESLSIWDNIIFAMAPLGLLTTIVSVLRVCGTPSMRAFIGRAQESPGQAELELLSCTSETTSELFNEGGIARVFGDPRILEVMVRPSGEGTAGRLIIGLFSDVGEDYWDQVKPSGSEGIFDKKSRSRYHRPNLSLNVGITKVSPIAQYSAAAVGALLQTGVLVFAAWTVCSYPNSFKIAEGKLAEIYAYPLAFCGTVLINEGPPKDGAALRTRRMDKTRNVLFSLESPDGDREQHPLFKYPRLLHGHELDFFALHLFNIDTISITADSHASLQSIPLVSAPYPIKDVGDALEARQKLADITGCIDGHSWDDLEVRTVASQLASTIEGVMEVLCLIQKDILRSASYELAIKLDTSYHRDQLSHINSAPPRSTTVHLNVKRRLDGRSWRADSSQLEALLGLWGLSLKIHDAYRRPDRVPISNNRIIAAYPDDLEKAEIWSHVWIGWRVPFHEIECIVEDGAFRFHGHEETRLRLFGSLERLKNGQRFPAAVQVLSNIGGKTEAREGTMEQNHAEGLRLQNSTVEAMADFFENSGLGSREDAYMCIIPILQRSKKMPNLKDVVGIAIEQSGKDKGEGNWEEAEGLLRWLSESSNRLGDQRPYEALVSLYRSAMLTPDSLIYGLGFDGICRMLNETMVVDPDIEQRIQECAWVGLRIAEEHGLNDKKTELLRSGAKEDIVRGYSHNLSVAEWAKRNNFMVMKYLSERPSKSVNWNAKDEFGLTALHWAIKRQNNQIFELFTRLQCRY
ncbi:hypothetical protein Dda_7137 [Drechslerella dactyloides]|uniref:Uncharacterized protein n=1 Tax=Drechslerella dactyloides TaxID=74499 RepID=A0AAD6NIS1_DREDA|nr:hypothetical protein Dda_7137 [Drechslerella dactyloides]